MDLVDEEDVAFAEIRQGADEVAGFFEGGAGGVPNIDAELASDELSEGGFAESGRAEEEGVVEGLSSRECGIYIDAQGLLHAALADEFGQALRAKRELDYA